VQDRVASARKLDPLRAVVTERLALSVKERELVVSAVLERKAVDQLQGGLLRFKPRRQIKKLVEIHGLELLNEALGRGRGCLLYSGHFRGQWSFFACLGLLGYHPLLIRQSFPSSMSRTASWFQQRFNRMIATKFGCDFLWMESNNPFVGATAAAHLRKNAVLINLIDVSTYTQRVVEVDFLNNQEAFPVGTALLSQLTGAPLLGYSIHFSPPESRYICEIGPIHSPAKDLRESTQQAATRIDASIRAHPADWAGWQKPQYLHGQPEVR
jgi:lauroyl/myristoyl acyltransferase